ncbi:cadherin-7 isoform X1 [Alosa sapidissima]|uniref:cadherin-7 isoform X1 n=1 Tax=Alosa sapidissima TaxID=34773 RepID=UPI001C098896|nr:cadherin-7 isoform X1 [Alosa sapidissima]XP_041924548.1 cadherin-7 isoform X1 [Alosa sapidissima]
MDCAVLPMVIITFMLPGYVLADRGAPNSVYILQSTTSQLAPHPRLKRGWIWNELFVEEEDPILRVIGKLITDSDTGNFAIKYILSGEGAGEIFEIDEYTGEISCLKTLDREEKAFYILQAQAIDRRTEQPVEPESEFIIKVKDVNDNAPVFQNEPYVSSIPEMCPMGTTVVQVTATDADDPLTGSNAKLIYSILQGDPYFSVEPKTGLILTSWPNMDREARERYLVVVQVKDMMGLNGGYSATTTVTITLSDVNDNGPNFQHNLYTFAVPESAALGTTVGRIMAEDGDVGVNARMNYSLEDLEESSTFKIQTDPVTQEGVILLAKPLDYESKRRFVIAVDAINDHLDTRFLSVYEFSDRTTVKIMVEDVDEPPVFSALMYEWKVPENAVVGTQVGTVSARDTDAANNPILYSMAKGSDMRNVLRIDPNNGTVTVAKPLDRETDDWHNLTISAKETREGYLSSFVEVFIRVLDINDNAPQLSREYQPHICEGTQAGEVIQMISATDPDDPMEDHHFYFSMVPEKNTNPNFTIRDNQDNTAGILARRSTFSRKDRTQYVLPVVVTDSGSPAMSSTSTLTISVCICQPAGHCPSGGVEAFALSMGLNLQGLMGLLVCLATLAVLSALIIAVRRHRKRNQEKLSVDEMETLEYSEKVLRYSEPNSNQNDCLPAQVPLRPHPRRRERRLRREEVAASIRMSLRHSHLIGPEDDVFRQFIMDRLAEADQDPYAPPFDCLRTYAFEGTGSDTGSLSSLESCTVESGAERAREPTTRFFRLTPWMGRAEEETSF